MAEEAHLMSQNAFSTSSGAYQVVNDTPATPATVNPWLRRYSKLLTFSILLLIFFGGQVKSHEAGLSVPDWPLTYGQNPITYPVDQWVGGIFHEHFHRLIAGCVAMGSVLLAAWIWFADTRRWMRGLALGAVVMVLVQAVLGGMTVWYQLPVWISSSHALLAQTYLLLNVVLAYGLSKERQERISSLKPGGAELRTPILYGALGLVALLYVQLLLGALTRHSEAGLAIPDFPTTAGQWVPAFTQETLDKINLAREGKTDAVGTPLDPVTMGQVVVHFLHRLGAVAIVAFIALVTWLSIRFEKTHPQLMTLSYLLCGTVIAQFVLGMTIVLTMRSPAVASLHVATGAATLALAGVLALRAWPLSAHED